MKTIINNTGHVIVVSNNYFSKEIAIDDTVTITDSELNHDNILSVRFFSLKSTKTKNKIEVFRDIDRSLLLWFSSSSKIPLQTEMNVKDSDTVVLTTQTLSFHLWITLCIKNIQLQRIVVKKDKIPHTFSFVNSIDQKSFFRKLCLELAILFPICLLLLLMLPFAYISYTESWGIFEYTLLNVITLLFTGTCTRKLFFCVSTRKYKPNKRSM